MTWPTSGGIQGDTDYKKKVNLEEALEMFSLQLKEQRMSLAETFSAQIF